MWREREEGIVEGRDGTKRKKGEEKGKEKQKEKRKGEKGGVKGEKEGEGKGVTIGSTIPNSYGAKILQESPCKKLSSCTQGT